MLKKSFIGNKNLGSICQIRWSALQAHPLSHSPTISKIHVLFVVGTITLIEFKNFSLLKLLIYSYMYVYINDQDRVTEFRNTEI